MTSIQPIILVLMCHIGLYVLSAGVAVLSPGVSAFTPVVRNRSPNRRFHQFREHVHDGKRPSFGLRAESTASSSTTTLSSSEKGDILGMIRSMRVKELKAELEKRKISTADAFEKEELVKRLYDARLKSPTPPKGKETIAAASSKRNTDSNVIRGELSFVSLESGQSIEGTYNSESVRITDADIQPYPTMTIQVVDKNHKDGGFPLKLLADTACSGFLLTPSAAQKHNLRSDSRPVTMTGAGGTAASASGFGATQIDRFTFGYENDQLPKEILGPILAVVQDTGALDPLGLDGIIGLSFFGKYACTEIDLDRSEISLYKTDYRPPYDESDLEVVAEGELSPTRLGIWTVDMAFDLGGKQGTPIKMLVDTGSTSTILSWKGLQDGLGLSRTSPEVKIQQEMGAMGSDNVAMSLTHKIEVDRPIRFGKPRGRSPPPYKGLMIEQGQTVSVDIGEIAVVDTQLSADNVGGILGMNVLSKASMIRMVFSGPIPRITLFQKKDRSTSKTNSSDNSRSGDEGDSSESNKPNDPNPNPATTAKSQVEAENDSATTSAPAPEETKSRRKKKKRRY